MSDTFTDHFIQRFRFIFMALMSTEFRQLHIVYATELNPTRTAYSISNPFKLRAQLILRFFFFVFTMKRSATSASDIEIEPEPEGEVKRKVVSLKTFQKWRTEMDRELKTIFRLCSSEAIENGKKIVKELKCSVCAKFRIQIMCRRNFSDYWITGASSIRTSNIRDHAKSDQHLHAMSLLQ